MLASYSQFERPNTLELGRPMPGQAVRKEGRRNRGLSWRRRKRGVVVGGEGADVSPPSPPSLPCTQHDSLTKKKKEPTHNDNMCRWFAYISPDEECLLEDVLITPEHGIAKQVHDHYLPKLFSHVPGEQTTKLEISLRNRLNNVDGFGLVWYTPVRSSFITSIDGMRPATYKNAQPPNNDANFHSICAGTSTTAVFAHIRAATGTSVAAINNHPFVFGRHTIMHNGLISHFTDNPPSLYYSTTAGVTLNRKYPGNAAGTKNPNATLKPEDHGKHFIVASEPTTYKIEEWKVIEKNHGVLVDKEGNCTAEKIEMPQEFLAQAATGRHF
ncbi:hypothetical protein CLAIMM_10630 isoform 2 [Cladophialophora immunda]|nr:hypothetical protein CLAIMM_10630 isoform 2 [Cladophialophora immunda]